MAIAILGDIHGSFSTLKILDNMLGPEIKAIIQVGDFGFYPECRERWQRMGLTRPVYVIDGNHERHDILDQDNGVQEMGPNLYFVPRGTVLDIDGRSVGFLGGAASVDKEIRLRDGEHWSPGENIKRSEVARFDAVESVDLLVTHVPPQSVIQQHFDPATLEWFGLPKTWKDPNADVVEKLWTRLGKPQLVCGHMHRGVIEGPVRILNIGEAIAMA